MAGHGISRPPPRVFPHRDEALAIAIAGQSPNARSILQYRVWHTTLHFLTNQPERAQPARLVEVVYQTCYAHIRNWAGPGCGLGQMLPMCICGADLTAVVHGPCGEPAGVGVYVIARNCDNKRILSQ
jgi:hypothetical protein